MAVNTMDNLQFLQFIKIYNFKRVFFEGDLGMFGLTETPTKRGPPKRAIIFLETAENHLSNNAMKKAILCGALAGALGPCRAYKKYRGPQIFSLNRAWFRLNRALPVLSLI